MLAITRPLIAQTTTALVGRWEAQSGVNKKYSSKNCIVAGTAWNFVFSPKGTYTRSVKGSTSIFSGKYAYDPKSGELRLFQGRGSPGNFILQDLVYKVIKLTATELVLNECVCKQSESDPDVDVQCNVTYSRLK